MEGKCDEGNDDYDGGRRGESRRLEGFRDLLTGLSRLWGVGGWPEARGGARTGVGG